MSRCTFVVLRKLLLDLGFQTKAVTQSYVVLEHEPARATLMFPRFSDDETVDPATLAVVSRTLDEKGVLAREKFRDQLQERSLAS